MSAPHEFKIGDVVLAKIKGFPSWPGIIMDDENVPRAVLEERPSGKSSLHTIRFFPAADYHWASARDLKLLTNEDIDTFLEGSTRKSGDLLKAYKLAKDPHKWNAEQNRIVKEANDWLEEHGDEEEEEEESAALAFHNAIKAKADIGQVAGDGILVLKEVLILTPRGRYDIDLFPTFLRLRGKTYDYKILYSSITQLFLLPKPDDIHVLFIVALDPPVRQGQTRYPFLVLQFPREEEMDAELNLDEETIQTKYEGKLKKRYEEPTFRIVTNLFRVFSQQKVHVPTGFTNSTGQESVRCNVKANDGMLYPLNKSLIWVSKQPILISYHDVHQFVFSRVGGAIASAKTFDLRVELQHGTDHTFQSISREELDSLNNFFAERKLRVKNELTDEAMGVGAAVDELLGEDDENVTSGKRGRGDDEDDDDEEEDEDFEAESEDDGGSPSEASSDDEDGDAVVSEEDEKPKPKKPRT